MYNKLSNAAGWLKEQHQSVPQVGLVLGSGLGAFVETIEQKIVIPYSDIPNFPKTSIEGHEGRLIFGNIGEVSLAVLQGRVHAYEGHTMEQLVLPVRVLARLGIESLILTNAAGAVNSNFLPGDLVLIRDHINFMGRNPLVGPNMDQLGPRFPDMTCAYHPRLNEKILESAQEMGLKIKTGVYAAMLGPTYETPAEINMLRVLGADMVGMSTVPEAIAANHLGMSVCGISCITNMAAGMGQDKIKKSESKKIAENVIELFVSLLGRSIVKIGTSKRISE